MHFMLLGLYNKQAGSSCSKRPQKKKCMHCIFLESKKYDIVEKKVHYVQIFNI